MTTHRNTYTSSHTNHYAIHTTSVKDNYNWCNKCYTTISNRVATNNCHYTCSATLMITIYKNIVITTITALVNTTGITAVETITAVPVITTMPNDVRSMFMIHIGVIVHTSHTLFGQFTTSVLLVCTLTSSYIDVSSPSIDSICRASFRIPCCYNNCHASCYGTVLMPAVIPLYHHTLYINYHLSSGFIIMFDHLY